MTAISTDTTTTPPVQPLNCQGFGSTSPKQHGRWHNGTYFLEVPYADPRQLLLEILRHIPHAQVLGPKALQEAFACRVRQAAQALAEKKIP